MSVCSARTMCASRSAKTTGAPWSSSPTGGARSDVTDDVIDDVIICDVINDGQVAVAWLPGDVPVFLRHQRPVESHRREDVHSLSDIISNIMNIINIIMIMSVEDVHDSGRGAQHDVAVTGRRHLWPRLPPTANSLSVSTTLPRAFSSFVLVKPWNSFTRQLILCGPLLVVTQCHHRQPIHVSPFRAQSDRCL